MVDQNNTTGTDADASSVPNDYTQAGTTVPLSDASAAAASYQSAGTQAGAAASAQPFSNPYMGSSASTAATTPVSSATGYEAAASTAAYNAAQPTAQMPSASTQAQTAQPASPFQAASTTATAGAQGYANPYAQAADGQYTQGAVPSQTTYDPYGQPMAPAPQGYTGQGTVPLVLGICSIVFAGLIGLVLGIIAIIKGKKALELDPEDGRAKAGKITGIIGVILSALLTIFVIGIIVASGMFLSDPNNQQLIEESLESAYSENIEGLEEYGDNFAEEMEPTPVNEDKDAAVKSAQEYNEMFHMSKQGLMEQLTSEYGDHYTEEAAQAAIDGLNADWNANALATAQDYVSMNMSKKGIFDQLSGEYGAGFTEEEAQYAIDNVEADWNANALATAKSYMEFSPDMTTEDLRDMLVADYGEQFTEEEANYAIEHLNDGADTTDDSKA